MSNPCQSVRQLYFEGFATRVSQMLYRENFYHQNQNGWLSFCRDNIDSIKQAYWEKILNQESTSCFFGDWHTFMGYSNLGYYLGCEWMRKMERKYTIQEIAGLTDRIIETEARAFLNNQE